MVLGGLTWLLAVARLELHHLFGSNADDIGDQ
jgi:hypothetical protein